MIELSEFARRKGVSEARALEMVDEGRYHGKEIDGIWYIDPRRIRTSSRAILTGEMPAIPDDVSPDTGEPSVPLLLIALALLAAGGLGAVVVWPDPKAFIWGAVGFVTAVLMGAFAVRRGKR